MYVSLTKREGQKSLRVMPIVIVRTLSISVPIIYINEIRGIGFTIRSKRTNWSDYATRWCARHFNGADGGCAEESREGRAQAAGGRRQAMVAVECKKPAQGGFFITGNSLLRLLPSSLS
jgi:hypothetical protein